MIDKIIETIKHYGLQNNDILTEEQKIELKKQIEYLENIRSIDTYKTRINLLQNALINKTSSNKTTDSRVSRSDYIEIYKKCTDRMFEETENQIYKDMLYNNATTIHWNGIYCDCSSGAQIYDYVIDCIENIDSELNGEEDGE